MTFYKRLFVSLAVTLTAIATGVAYDTTATHPGVQGQYVQKGLLK
jgi:hypothetical protein